MLDSRYVPLIGKLEMACSMLEQKGSGSEVSLNDGYVSQARIVFQVPRSKSCAPTKYILHQHPTTAKTSGSYSHTKRSTEQVHNPTDHPTVTPDSAATSPSSPSTT